MQLSSFGITNLGKVRHTNEDALFIDKAHQVYAVADGLGGLPGGAEASQRIVQLLEQTMKSVSTWLSSLTVSTRSWSKKVSTLTLTREWGAL
jgi:serine/threonine protein phosphatase PrpC